jgi:hypothetical protein
MREIGMSYDSWKARNPADDELDSAEQLSLEQKIVRAWDVAIRKSLGVTVRCEGDAAAKEWNLLCGLMEDLREIVETQEGLPSCEDVPSCTSDHTPNNASGT